MSTNNATGCWLRTALIKSHWKFFFLSVIWWFVSNSKCFSFAYYGAVEWRNQLHRGKSVKRLNFHCIKICPQRQSAGIPEISFTGSRVLTPQPSPPRPTTPPSLQRPAGSGLRCVGRFLLHPSGACQGPPELSFMSSWDRWLGAFTPRSRSGTPRIWRGGQGISRGFGRRAGR